MKYIRNVFMVLTGVLALGLAAPSAAAQSEDASAKYEAARRVLNAARYTEAVDMFRAYRSEHPRARYAGESMYWEGFALSRLESLRHLREATAVLEAHLAEHPSAATADDAKALLARVRGEMANRGDSESAEWVYRETVDRQRDAERDQQREARQDRDRRSDETKLVALNALMQMDSEAAIPILRGVVQDTDNAPELRVHALFILSQHEEDGIADMMLQVARTDPHPEVREQAVFWLSQNDSPETVTLLEQILSNEGDVRLHQHAVFALSQMSDPAAGRILKEYAQSESADAEIRANAVFWLAQHPSAENATFLRQLFARSGDARTREAVLFALSQMPGQGNGEWLMDIALDTSEETEMRTQALFMASQADEVTVADLVSVYDSARDRELKTQALFILSQSDQPTAFDKLLDVVRNEGDSEIRQNAIFWIGQSDDPRAEQVLLDIIRD